MDALKAVVCVLYHPGDPHRDALWKYARQRWQRYGFEPVEGYSPLGLYAARNVAAASVEWDVALFADADIVLAEKRQADEAILEAAEGGYVLAYDEMVYLGEQATRRALRRRPIERVISDTIAVGIWEGAFAVNRELWDALGGFDERFAGRKGQVTAFIHAAGTISGRQLRVPGRAYHLWHPPRTTEQPDAPELRARYYEATGNREAMLALVQEPR